MRLSTFILSLIAVAVPAAGHAHFLWASIDPKTHALTVEFAEVLGDRPLPLAKRGKLIRAFGKPNVAVPLKAEGDRYVGPSNLTSGVAALNYGVLDKREQGRGLFWLYYYAKAATTVEASQTIWGSPVELTVSGNIVTVLKSSKPVAGAEVVVVPGDTEKPFKAKSDSEGHVTLPPLPPGPLSIRALLNEESKGTEGGVAYDFIRRYATLHLREYPGQASQTAKSLTRLLHEAFGNDHEVVGQTAFIRTLMDRQLTKSQLEAHFQQRALIHDAVHRVLVKSKAVPYGEAQKNVLVLLFGDLMAIDSEWPVKTQAWSVTRDFLQEIEESGKKGPFFALGVMHVYYGGITHGGRNIGQIIADTLKVTPSYYLKSDGYDAYAKHVNAITNPTDQQEMIRGGQAAYRYIIASNNDVFFKKK